MSKTFEQPLFDFYLFNDIISINTNIDLSNYTVQCVLLFIDSMQMFSCKTNNTDENNLINISILTEDGVSDIFINLPKVSDNALYGKYCISLDIENSEGMQENIYANMITFTKDSLPLVQNNG